PRIGPARRPSRRIARSARRHLRAAARLVARDRFRAAARSRTWTEPEATDRAVRVRTRRSGAAQGRSSRSAAARQPRALDLRRLRSREPAASGRARSAEGRRGGRESVSARAGAGSALPARDPGTSEALPGAARRSRRILDVPAGSRGTLARSGAVARQDRADEGGERRSGALHLGDAAQAPELGGDAEADGADRRAADRDAEPADQAGA